MGCAPSIHISEGRAAYHGGKEAEDAPGAAAAPPPPAGPRLPPGQKTTASPGARGAGLAESEPRDGSGRKVRGAGRAAGAGEGSGAAVRGPRRKSGPAGRQLSRGGAGRGALPGRVPSRRALGHFDGRQRPLAGAASRGQTEPRVLGPSSVGLRSGRPPSRGVGSRDPSEVSAGRARRELDRGARVNSPSKSGEPPGYGGAPQKR